MTFEGMFKRIFNDLQNDVQRICMCFCFLVCNHAALILGSLVLVAPHACMVKPNSGEQQNEHQSKLHAERMSVEGYVVQKKTPGESGMPRYTMMSRRSPADMDPVTEELGCKPDRSWAAKL